MESAIATEKTPVHKRISRAESSVAQWKMKAIERREENEILKEQLKTAQENAKVKGAELGIADKRQIDLEKQIAEFTDRLELRGLTSEKNSNIIPEKFI